MKIIKLSSNYFSGLVKSTGKEEEKKPTMVTIALGLNISWLKCFFWIWFSILTYFLQVLYYFNKKDIKKNQCLFIFSFLFVSASIFMILLKQCLLCFYYTLYMICSFSFFGFVILFFKLQNNMHDPSFIYIFANISFIKRHPFDNKERYE